MPPREQDRGGDRARRGGAARLKGELVIDMVIPDYYARYPKPCAGGWGRIAINVSPSGKVLPCHAAEVDSRPRILECARSSLERHLALKPRLQGLPRHGLDARALPLVRPAGDRLGRVPLPGAGADRRRARRPIPPATSRPITSASWRRRWPSPNPATGPYAGGRTRRTRSRPEPPSAVAVRKNACLSTGCGERGILLPPGEGGGRSVPE